MGSAPQGHFGVRPRTTRCRSRTQVACVGRIHRPSVSSAGNSSVANHRRPALPNASVTGGRSHRLRARTPPFVEERESGGTRDKDGFVLSAHPGKSQGRPRTTSSSQLISQIGLPDRVSQQRPKSREHDAPGRSRRQFHPRITGPPTSRSRTRSPARRSVSSTCARGPTGPAPTGRPSGSSAPCWVAGPTARSTPQAPNAPRRSLAGSSSTTGDDHTALSATSHPEPASTS